MIIRKPCSLAMLYAVMALLLLSANSLAERPLRLATTTSTENSGLLKLLQPRFQQEAGIPLLISVVGSGRALQMGRAGEVDVILTHSPKAEQRFVADGYGLRRHAIMSNDFVLVGPASDSARVASSNGVNQALRRIASQQALFVSRGDNSGTHRKERKLWQQLDIDPHWQHWYQELGASMADTLAYCSEQQAYTLTDRGTWLARQHALSLALLYSGDPLLLNPYSAIAINPAKHPDTNHRGAQQFIDWLRSDRTRQLIGDFRINQQPLFKPSRH